MPLSRLNDLLQWCCCVVSLATPSHKTNFAQYIDPSYIIRSAPALASDEEFCVMLAQMAAHAGMSGKTDCVVGYVGSSFVCLPLERIAVRSFLL